MHSAAAAETEGKRVWGNTTSYGEVRRIIYCDDECGKKPPWLDGHPHRISCTTPSTLEQRYARIDLDFASG